MSLKVVVVYAVCLIFLGVLCEALTPVRKCSENLPFPLSVQINDCEVLPCIAIRGSTAFMDVHFVAVSPFTKNILAEVNAKVFGLVMPFPLPDDMDNVCQNLLYSAYCPLYATEDVVYHLVMHVENAFPEITTKVEVKLFDDDNTVVACFNVDMKIRKAKPTNIK